MADGTVRVNFAADVSDVRRGTQQVVKEIDKVNRAADKSAAGAARSSSKALTGVLRLIQTGDVSSKKLDKIGKSASGLLGGLSSIGVGLGLGALPLASDIAVKAIKAIQKSTESLTDRINTASLAQRGLNLSQVATRGSMESLTSAQAKQIDAQQKLDRANLNANHSTEYMAKLERDLQAAKDDVTVASYAREDAIKAEKKAQDEYASKVKNALDKLVDYNHEGARGKQMLKDQADYGRKAAQVLLDLSGSNRNLSDAQKDADRSLADYIRTADLTPKQIKTLITLSGHGKTVAQLLELLGLTKKLPKKKDTKIATPGIEKSIRDMQILRGEIASLHSKSINVTVNRNEREGTGKTPAVGARVAGTFDGRDNIPVSVSKGEVILNPRQQSLIDGGMSIDRALSATGAMTIGPGGAYAKGGRREDRSMDTFLGSTILDRLALASSTLTDTDDRSAAAFARDRVDRILRSGKLGKRKLSVTERRMLLEALGGYRRDALPPDTTPPNPTTDTSTDPFALDRARQAGVTEGTGRANAYVFGGAGDIGSGGANAIMAAGSVHFENVSFTNSVQNTAAFAQASNVGNDLISGGRIRSSRQTVAFGG